MGSLLKESRSYQLRKSRLSQDDRNRLEYEEQRIAAGEEDYRATEGQGTVRIHYFDYGLISFQRLRRDLVLLIAFRLFAQL